MTKSITLRPGSIAGIGDVYVTLKWDGLRLSITGVSGPLANGDARGSCGQCRGELSRITRFADNWTGEMVTRLSYLWGRWHSNDMRAGSPAQEQHLRENPISFTYPESHYDAARKTLESAGLHPDAEGYHYGSEWRFEYVPDDVIAELFAFPIADKPLPGAWRN